MTKVKKAVSTFQFYELSVNIGYYAFKFHCCGLTLSQVFDVVYNLLFAFGRLGPFHTKGGLC